MKIIRSQTGFSPLHVLLMLVLLGIIGFTGWKVYDASKSAEITSSSTVTPAANQTQPQSPGSTIPEGLVEYKSEELGIKFAYPKEWGNVDMKQGELVPPGHGNYRQVTFSKKDLVDINFVIDGFSSPLDACGYSGEPLTLEEYALNARRTSLVGWDAQNNLKLLFGPSQGDPNERLVLIGPTPSDMAEGFELIKTEDKVLVYKDLQKQTWRATSGAEAEICGEVTQTTADQANLFRKYIHFAANFTNAKIRGVNAQYDARNSYDQKISDQLTTVLNTVKSL